MIEKEWKWLVPRETFESLLHIASSLSVSKGEVGFQINHYYDTIDHRLGEEGICVRVRQTEDTPLLGTVKKHGKNGISEESNFKTECLPRFITYQNMLLHRLGALMTKRTKFRLDGIGILSFDRNFYLGVADYEIELEFSEVEKESDWKHISHDLLFGEKPTDKYTRFLLALNRFERICEPGADAGQKGENV